MQRSYRSVLSILVTALLGVTLLPGAVSANASKVEQPAIVSANPANFTPNVLDGKVNALVEVGGLIIAGGLFTQVQESGSGKPVLTRSNIMAFNATTGVVATAFAPTFDGEIKALTLAADGQSVYVGGSFRTVNGQVRDRLARIQVSDGSLTPGFAATSFNSRVNDLALRGDQLLVAGIFSYVGASRRIGLASVNATTGALTTYLSTNTNLATALTGIAQVLKFDMTPDRSTMFMIGNFTSIGGSPRTQIAKLTLGATSVTVADWATSFYASTCSTSFDTYMRDLDISPDGSYMVVTTTGAYRAPPASCDTWARFETGSSGADVKPTWVNYTGGDTTYAVEITGTTVYVGGHFRWANNPYSRDALGLGAVPRGAIAALDPRSGMPYAWDPTRERAVGVFDFLATTTGVWMGHDTSLVNGEYRRRVTFFPLAGGATPPVEKLGALPNDIYLTGRTTNATGKDEVRRVYFTGTSSPSDPGVVPSADAWGSSRGSFLVDSSLYAGWSDGRLTKRSFDGQSFGTPTDVELYTNGFTTDSRAFANDLPNVSGMFFDKAKGRLYYTKKGDSRLLWRGFSPQSDIVGPLYDGMPTTFYPGQGDVGVLDPANVQGMFLSGDRLYFASAADGNLWSVGFAGGTVVGPKVLADQSMDWRARGAFIWNGKPVTGPPNVAPVAAFSESCSGLLCSFDGSASNDPDGDGITAYSWDFAGAGTSTDAKPTFTFAAAGAYQVSLTVTDGRGGSGSVARTITVSDAVASTVGFRDRATYTGNVTTARVRVPTTVQPGDGLLLFVSNASGVTPTSITPGWTLLGERNLSNLRSQLYVQTATATSPGSEVVVVLPSVAKQDLTMLAYSGTATSPVGAWAAATESTSTRNHAAPELPVGTTSSWVMSYWVDRTSTGTGTWGDPAGSVRRSTLAGSGGGKLSSLAVDYGTAAPQGTWPTKTAVAEIASSAAVMWTIELRSN